MDEDSTSSIFHPSEVPVNLTLHTPHLGTLSVQIPSALPSVKAI